MPWTIQEEARGRRTIRNTEHEKMEHLSGKRMNNLKGEKGTMRKMKKQEEARGRQVAEERRKQKQDG